MTRRSVVVATAIVLGATVGSGFGLRIGDSIPSADVAMKNVDGRELAIKDVTGPKGTLVIFTCNHCPYVKAWEGRIVALANDAVKRGVGVIAINPNDPTSFAEDSFDAMKEKSSSRGYAFPYAVDAGASRLARAFGASHTPEAFLFDATGALVYHGAIDDNVEDAAKVTRHFLRDAVDAVVAGVRPAVAESKAIGCSIKFRS